MRRQRQDNITSIIEASTASIKPVFGGPKSSRHRRVSKERKGKEQAISAHGEQLPRRRHWICSFLPRSQSSGVRRKDEAIHAGDTRFCSENCH